MNKKFLTLSVAALSLISLASCGSTETSSDAGTSSSGSNSSIADSSSTGGSSSSAIDVALITDTGGINDQSFNQYTYVGVKTYCNEKGLTYTAIEPGSESTTTDRVNAMKQAVANGAKALVLPGYLHEDAVYEVQSLPEFENVMILLLDGEPHTADYSTYYTNSNVHNVLYKEQEAGYFAGYAAVAAGYTELGYMGGMEIPSVQKYGYGYVIGAIDAANDKGVKINFEYDYAGTFSANDSIYTTTSNWYDTGTEVIFSCGGGIYLSILNAANNTSDGKVIGVDVDQRSQSDRIITSAMKDLEASTIDALGDLFDDVSAEDVASHDYNVAWSEDYAGKTATVGAAEGMVGIPTAEESWDLGDFTVAEYEAIYEKVAADSSYTGIAYDSVAGFTFSLDSRDLSCATISYGDEVATKIPGITEA